jgi:hypothetical protein
LIAIGNAGRRAKPDVVLNAAAEDVGRVDFPDTLAGGIGKAERRSLHTAEGIVELAVRMATTATATALLRSRWRRERAGTAIHEQQEECGQGYQDAETDPANDRSKSRHISWSRSYSKSRAQRNPMYERARAGSRASRTVTSALDPSKGYEPPRTTCSFVGVAFTQS